MSMRMKLSAGEILDIAAWVEKLGFNRGHEIIIEQDSNSGIGTSITARTNTSEKEGIFIDVTDYDTW